MSLGFGICTWWKLIPPPSMRNIVGTIREKLNSPPFPLHITVGTHGTAAAFAHPPPPSVCLTKTVKASSIYMWGTTFNAVELKVNGDTLPGSAHISLAYRVGKPFSEEEVTYVCELVAQINSKDTLQFEFCKYNASSQHCNEWFRVW